MSEYMWGVTHDKVSRREFLRRDRACRNAGGYGYTQIDESYGTADGGRWLGWFSGPNRGEPFDSDLVIRVTRALL